jgi:hypothetical protein
VGKRSRYEGETIDILTRRFQLKNYKNSSEAGVSHSLTGVMRIMVAKS